MANRTQVSVKVKLLEIFHDTKYTYHSFKAVFSDFKIGYMYIL